MAVPNNQIEIKRFLGLFLQPNSFNVPDGALEQAQNAVIVKDGVLESRKGYFTFNTPPGGATANHLGLYQDTLMSILSNAIQYVNSGGTGTSLTGETVAVTGNRVSRTAQANGNFYFTTDNGVLKLEAYNSQIYQDGIPPALDITGKFDAANGPIKGNTQVGYRVVFGRTDANNNLLLGAPSDIVVLINRKEVAEPYALVSNVVTVTTAEPHNLVTNMSVNITNDSNSFLDGPVIIMVTGPNTFTFAAVHADTTGTLDWDADRNTNLEFSIPSEINSTEFFWQLYRTSQSADDATIPAADFKLVQQSQLTSAQLSQEVVFYVDSTLDIFLGAELYTNPNSQEGELQANYKPPLTEDLAYYKNHMFYANIITRHILNLNLVSTSTTYINAGDFIEVKLGGTTRRYVAVSGIGNETTPAETVTGTNTLTITITGHGFSNGYTVLVTNIQGGSFASGTYTVAGVTANTFTITGTGTASGLDVQGVTDGTYPIFQLVPPGSSVAVGIDSTARNIVKAINRDTLSPVYAHYISGVTDVPGKMRLEGKTFAGSFQVRANSTQVGLAFSPELPATFGAVESSNDVLPNFVYSSKVGEPEAVPVVNGFPVGSQNKKILRIFALRDSCVVLKEDGVWRIDGDDVSNFSATLIDGTVICLVPSSAALLNNQVVFLSNQGVAMASNNAVQIISRRIEDPITPILGYPTLVAQTSGVAYESSRLYLLTTLLPNTSVASVVYCYNTLSDTWTSWDKTFRQGLVGPQDTMFLITPDNKIKKERKNQLRTDYADESFAVTAVTVASDKFSAVISSPSHTPQKDEIIVYSGIITRINKVTPIGGSNFNVIFDNVTNLINGASATLYTFFQVIVKLAPYHAGRVNSSKQFSQMQVHLRDDSVSAIDISYTTDTFGGSEVTNWKQTNVAIVGGWGQQPWGFFPWGQDNGIQLNYETKPAPIIRTYIPLFSQRCTFIQPTLTHQVAGEILNIQSIDFTVRGYEERVSR